ncbi:hypothetical protein FD19_GL001134 [Lacticaseibacillus thailandensis DSM 22698 = JCM 13996]|uniref:HTH tetR-type domain-containing protein n=1 Tax=Lacticaseibacillus thailandensis DSM 22698 = JCM 13996 TaxID=1423810 RepID=A0A0R2CIU6_9LACO|nr:hypothetical protein FD19_GL001134 [Lacticaseibacillus thailandensis DSM 22698 = JCM 13996]
MRDGFEHTAISTIMRAAGLRRQTFYEYFDDKFAVAEWIIEDTLRDTIDQNFDYLRWEDILDLTGYELDAKKIIFRQLAEQREINFVGRLATHLEQLVRHVEPTNGGNGSTPVSAALLHTLCMGVAAEWNRQILGITTVDYEVVVAATVQAVQELGQRAT